MWASPPGRWSWVTSSARARRGTRRWSVRRRIWRRGCRASPRPQSVVISQATRRLVRGLFELEDLGPNALRASPSLRPLGGSKVKPVPRGASRQDRPRVLRRWSAGRRRSRCCCGAGSRSGTARARWSCSRASRDRQVAAGAEMLERLAGERHRGSCTMLPVSPDQPAAPVVDIWSAAPACARRSAEGEARQARDPAGAWHGQARRGRAAVAALLGVRLASAILRSSSPRSARSSGRWKRCWT